MGERKPFRGDGMLVGDDFLTLMTLETLSGGKTEWTEIEDIFVEMMETSIAQWHGVSSQSRRVLFQRRMLCFYIERR